MFIGRRQFLKLSSAAALSIGASVTSTQAFAKSASKRRHLHLKNMHTGEEERLLYWKNGKYVSASIEMINHLLRDHRSDETLSIDTGLIEAMYNIHAAVEAPYGIEIYSGYRSPKTNEALRKKNKGVAERSFHMFGKAVDIRMPTVKLSNIKRAAIALRIGGVGYYKNSGFVHIDTGRVRQWGS